MSGIGTQRKSVGAAAFALVLGASAAAGLPLLAGCSGGNGGGQHVGSSSEATDALSRAVRVAIRFTQPAPAGYADRITPQAKADAEASGFVFQPTEIVYPITPATGYYLKIADKFYAAGPDGVFSVPNGVAVSGDVPLYKQLTDDAPLGTVQIAGALKPGSEAPQTVYLDLHGRILGSASEMDGTSPAQTASKSAPRSCCVDKKGGTPLGRAVADGCTRYDPNVASNDPAVSACYDFDLSKGRILNEDANDDSGDVLTGDGFCVSKRVAEFVGTPCWKWTWGSGGYTAECINERAILQVTGPSCWANHKYRFCQNMDPTDFSVTAPASLTVTVGQTLALTVRNNTPKYNTLVTLTGDAQGTLTGTGVVGMGGGSYRIEHYDDGSTTYVASRSVTYVAPADLPDDKTEAYDTLTFTANGRTETVTIRVTKPCGSGNRGKAEAPCR